MIKAFYLVIAFSVPFLSISQDTVEVVTFEEYLTIVKENHPVTVQARLLSDMAESNARMARGGFDPKIEADWSHKSFDGKNYYSVINSAVKVPTWFGIDLKAGYNRNSGVFLDNSDELPSRGLWNAGISVPLGRGFIIDDRRAALKQAEVFNAVTIEEQKLMINDLLYEASIAYLEWQADQRYLTIAEDGLRLAQKRLEGTVSSFINGDKPAIDTLESYISYQTREIDLQKAQQDFINSKIALENYLWIDGNIPLELSTNVIPEAIDESILRYETDSISIRQGERLATHPEILLYDYKLDGLDIDRRLAREDLKPDLRVNYNPLLAVADDSFFDQFNPENYKVGATLAYPILQRKQRGKLQLNKIKIENTRLDRTTKLQGLTVKLDTYINNMRQATTLNDMQTQTLENYNRMLIAENRKLQAGESSIFLVNSRERKYLESRYKQVDVLRKLNFNKLTYLYYLVALNEVI